MFGFVVEGAGGFVEDNDVSLFVEGAGDTNALALPSGEADPAFANVGFVFFWPGFDDVGNLCLLSGFFDTIEVNVVFWEAKGYVFFYGAVGQEDGLRDMSYMGLPCTVVTCSYRLFVNFEGTLCGLQETHDDVEQGTFTTTGYTNKANAAAFANGEMKIFKHIWCIRGIAEQEVFDINLMLEWDWLCWRLVGIVGHRLIEQFERILQGGLASLDG